MCNSGVITVCKEVILLYYIPKDVFSMSLKFMIPVTQEVRFLSRTVKNRKLCVDCCRESWTKCYFVSGIKVMAPRFNGFILMLTWFRVCSIATTSFDVRMILCKTQE